jgi:hypothetical protein
MFHAGHQKYMFSFPGVLFGIVSAFIIPYHIISIWQHFYHEMLSRLAGHEGGWGGFLLFFVLFTFSFVVSFVFMSDSPSCELPPTVCARIFVRHGAAFSRGEPGGGLVAIPFKLCTPL